MFSSLNWEERLTPCLISPHLSNLHLRRIFTCYIIDHTLSQVLFLLQSSHFIWRRLPLCPVLRPTREIAHDCTLALRATTSRPRAQACQCGSNLANGTCMKFPLTSFQIKTELRASAPPFTHTHTHRDTHTL